MRFQLIPRQHNFFDLFDRQSEAVVGGARLLQELLADFADRVQKHERIREREHEGDEITHEIMRALNTSFVTPFDREDIHGLASGMDDILDFAEAVADLIVLHQVEEPLPEMRQQADVLVKATVEIQEALAGLRTFNGLEKHWVEINRLENEGDRIYRKTVARLFSGEFKAMDVLKWKDLVDQMEEAIDGCEDIANAIESIVLKHA
jgi:predicted phosphate transport protein (TIGR00153 family)